jgi:hypothetical protein
MEKVDRMLEESRERKDICGQGKPVPRYEWMKRLALYGGSNEQVPARDANTG